MIDTSVGTLPARRITAAQWRPAADAMAAHIEDSLGKLGVQLMPADHAPLADRRPYAARVNIGQAGNLEAL
jgi:hypothetical protein